MLTYARQYRRQRTVHQRLRNFCMHEQKQNGSLISRESLLIRLPFCFCSCKKLKDRMLIKVLHQEKGSKKLLAEFPNKAFELIPTVFIMLETCVFSVSS